MPSTIAGRLLLGFLVFAPVPGATPAAPATPSRGSSGVAIPSPDLVRLAQELDDREAATHTRRDVAAVEALWSSDFVVTNLFGTVLSRSQAVERVRNGLILFSTMKRTVDEARREGDLLVTIGREEITGAPGGVLPPGKTAVLRYTHLWRDEAGTWRLFVRHASIPAPDPGAAGERGR